MERGKDLQTHSIAGTFVFLLLAVFAVMACVLTVFGARAYRETTAAAVQHNEERILSAYVRSMIRSEDVRGLVSVEELDGVQTLSLTQTYDGRAYVTRIYSYGGSLREWFSEAARAFAPESGEEICNCTYFSPKLAGGLLTLEMQAAPEAEPIELSIAVFAQEDEEAA